jgi:hypothetical protein
VIELLYWQGCPSHPRALAMLEEEMALGGIDPSELKLTELVTHEDAERERFIGSPTIRVDGEDISDPGDAMYGLECRLYHHRDGRPSPLPERDEIKEALKRHASKSQ